MPLRRDIVELHMPVRVWTALEYFRQRLTKAWKAVFARETLEVPLARTCRHVHRSHLNRDILRGKAGRHRNPAFY